MTERDRLFALIVSMPPEVHTAAEMTDYLLENGVIVPPCKVGDKVWYHDYVPTSRGLERILRSSEVKEITMHPHRSFVTLVNCVSLDLENFGKTAFLAREEAEAALERMKGAIS